jgi:hypothetical protein
MRKPSKREWILIALVPAVIIAAAADPADRARLRASAVANPDTPAKVEKRRVAEVEPPELTPPAAREAEAADIGNVFAAKSWYVPPPPPPPSNEPPPPPPKPTAPPLPFTYLGRYQDAGAPVIFLVRGDRILTVKQGDVIEGSYRVEGIVGATLTLTYMPLDIKQTLNIGSAG